MNSDISIIIPCYNTEPSLVTEAINSVKVNTGNYSYDIIIVDDGSTNKQTKDFLSQLDDDKISIIYQDNHGPAAARNNGVRNTESEFILFLDSDDRIKPFYIEHGIAILKEQPATGVVYANAEAFGDGSRDNFSSREFDIVELLIRNYIPMCSIVRKKAWEDVNGIDEKLIQYEDWEFWIRIYKAGWEFAFIKEPMFDYRISDSSLIAQEKDKKYREAIEYIYIKHWDLIYQQYHHLYGQRVIYQNDQQRPMRSFIKYCRNKFLKK